MANPKRNESRGIADEQSTGAESVGSGESADIPRAGNNEDEPLHRTSPTTRPVLVLIVFTVFGASLAGGFVVARPDLVGGGDLATVVLAVIGLLALVILLRLLLKIFIIRRTTYTITSTSLRREYELFYRRYEREIPVNQLRGHEFTQSRIQSLLSYGTIRILTGGTDRSLGFLEFEHIDDPGKVRESIRQMVESK